MIVMTAFVLILIGLKMLMRIWNIKKMNLTLAMNL